MNFGLRDFQIKMLAKILNEDYQILSLLPLSIGYIGYLRMPRNAKNLPKNFSAKLKNYMEFKKILLMLKVFFSIKLRWTCISFHQLVEYLNLFRV